MWFRSLIQAVFLWLLCGYADAACAGFMTPQACWLNSTCVWERGVCRVVASQCQFRVSVEECHRSTPVGYPLCYWDGIHCQSRYVHNTANENYCHGLFNYSNYVASAGRCHQDPLCEFDIYFLQCTMNRDLVCTNLRPLGMQACNLAAGCWWNDQRSECNALPRDYLSDCTEFSATDCPASECYVTSTRRCVAKLKVDSYEFPHIAAYCTVNSNNPFDLINASVTTADCLINRAPWCNISTATSAPRQCVPAKQFTCNYITTRDECDQYSFCQYGWRCYPQGDPAPPPPPSVEWTLFFSPFGDKTALGSSVFTLFFVYFAFVMISIAIAFNSMRVPENLKRN
jgi:hypothetical protein